MVGCLSVAASQPMGAAGEPSCTFALGPDWAPADGPKMTKSAAPVPIAGGLLIGYEHTFVLTLKQFDMIQ